MDSSWTLLLLLLNNDLGSPCVDVDDVRCYCCGYDDAAAHDDGWYGLDTGRRTNSCGEHITSQRHPVFRYYVLWKTYRPKSHGKP